MAVIGYQSFRGAAEGGEPGIQRLSHDLCCPWIPGSLATLAPGNDSYVPATKNEASREWILSAITLAARFSASRRPRAPA
jgi:hypothetical protein